MTPQPQESASPLRQMSAPSDKCQPQGHGQVGPPEPPACRACPSPAACTRSPGAMGVTNWTSQLISCQVMNYAAMPSLQRSVDAIRSPRGYAQLLVEHGAGLGEERGKLRKEMERVNAWRAGHVPGERGRAGLTAPGTGTGSGSRSCAALQFLHRCPRAAPGRTGGTAACREGQRWARRLLAPGGSGGMDDLSRTGSVEKGRAGSPRSLFVSCAGEDPAGPGAARRSWHQGQPGTAPLCLYAARAGGSWHHWVTSSCTHPGCRAAGTEP